MNEHIRVPFRLIYGVCVGGYSMVRSMKWKQIGSVVGSEHYADVRNVFPRIFLHFIFFWFFFCGGGTKDDRCAIDAISHVQYGGLV